MIQYKNVTVNVVFDTLNDNILMIRKNRNFRNFSSQMNSTGKDKWNCCGGKVEPNETFLQGVKRETLEETGLNALNPEPKIILDIKWPGQNLLNVVYVTTKFNGKVISGTDECSVLWVPRKDIPYDKMFNTDREWFPKVFTNKYYLYDISGELKNNDIISRVNSYLQFDKQKDLIQYVSKKLGQHIR